MRLDAWLASASARLTDADIEAARTEARVLAGYALRAEGPTLHAHPELEMPIEAEELLRRRLAGEPLSYIIGYREFYGRRFRVTPAVLIPRQETELLVETAIGLAPTEARVLDIGAGSGCVGITLKLERPDLAVTDVDISPDALVIARENATALDADLTFVEADLFPPERFDIIVSNPPYVAESSTLPPDVGGYEPHQALFAGPDGLSIYRRLAAQAGEYLTDGGLIAIELGDGMRASTEPLFRAQGWMLQRVERDLLGIDRILVFSIS